MDRLSALLQPYRAVVAKSAEVTTILQMFSGITMCNDIRKAGKSDEFPFMPFIAGAVFSFINLQFGVIVRDRTIINVSFVGGILSLLYCVWYAWYTSKEGKGALWGKISVGGAITAACIAYAKYEDPSKLEFRFGILMTVFLFAMVGAPLLDLGTIIRNKSVGQMPFAMTLMGGIVGFLWLLYSIILNNTLMIFQNVVMTSMTLFQLALFAIYPNKTLVAAAAVSDKKEKAKAKSSKAKKAD